MAEAIAVSIHHGRRNSPRLKGGTTKGRGSPLLSSLLGSIVFFGGYHRSKNKKLGLTRPKKTKKFMPPTVRDVRVVGPSVTVEDHRD